MSVGTFPEQASRLWDSYRTAADLIPAPNRLRQGHVVFADNQSTASDAQVVIVPRVHRREIALRDGRLISPWEYLHTNTGTDGRFEIAPAADDYDVLVLHKDGVGTLNSAITKTDTRIVLQKWGTLNLVAERVTDLEKLMISCNGENGLRFSLSGLIPTGSRLELKIPAGHVTVARLIDQGDGLSSVKRIAEIRMAPGEEHEVLIEP